MGPRPRLKLEAHSQRIPHVQGAEVGEPDQATDRMRWQRCCPGSWGARRVAATLWGEMDSRCRIAYTYGRRLTWRRRP
jgi:hypothetical protein